MEKKKKKKTLSSNAAYTGLVPGWEAKIPHALWTRNRSIKQKQYCNKLNKDFKNGPHQKILKIKKEEGKQELAIQTCCGKNGLEFLLSIQSLYKSNPL